MNEHIRIEGVVADSEDFIKSSADALGMHGFINYFSLQAASERIRQLEGQYADIHEIVRQLKETRETATGSNTSWR
ncbi:hypothetical protein LguiB_016754 [Lonicera macranthoides]